MTNEIQTPNFEEMSIAQLRAYASHLRVAVPKTATKESITEAIRNKLSGKTAAVLAEAGTAVPPGHAKIRLSEDPSPGAQNYPVYVNANGYVCTIPRGVDVIVPMRVVRVLNDAVVKRLEQIEGKPGEPPKDVMRTIQSYPFQVLEMTPGEEPLTKLELSKAKTAGPRVRYRNMFGRWPRPRELVRAIEQRLISMEDGEELSDAALKAIDTAKSDAMIED